MNCKCFANFLPYPRRFPAAVIGSQARALTRVVLSIPAGVRTRFRSIEWLDNIDASIFADTSTNEGAEPSHRNFPVRFAGLSTPHQLRVDPSARLKPCSIVDCVREPHIERRLLAGPKQNRNFLLVPDCADLLRRTFSYARRTAHRRLIELGLEIYDAAPEKARRKRDRLPKLELRRKQACAADQLRDRLLRACSQDRGLPPTTHAEKAF